MRTTIIIVGTCALLGSQIGSAAAAACIDEIDNVAKLLAAKDVGSGPTTGAAHSAGGQHPPTSAMSSADQGTAASAAAAESAKPQHPPTAAMNSAAQGGSAASGGAAPSGEQHPPTAAMNRATAGSAASPQDVQRQTQGQPTAAQQAEGARPPASGDRTGAQAALDRARGFAEIGKEAECMDAVRQARRLVQ